MSLDGWLIKCPKLVDAAYRVEKEFFGKRFEADMPRTRESPSRKARAKAPLQRGEWGSWGVKTVSGARLFSFVNES